MKDYHINIIGDSITVTKNINRKGVAYMREDFHNCWKKRFILEVGDKVVDAFGDVVTIKEILYHENTKAITYLIEENENCYQPQEFCGLFIKRLTLDEVKDIVGEIDDTNEE